MGIDGVKPDIHVCRFLGANRMGEFEQEQAGVSEAVAIVRKMSEQLHRPWWRSTASFGATAPVIMGRSAQPLHTAMLALCANSVPERKCTGDFSIFAGLGGRKDQGTVCHLPGTGTTFPGRHYTPDGGMVGSIGEALAASWYGLELFTAGAETHDAKAPDGRLVQIKATQIDRVALSVNQNGCL